VGLAAVALAGSLLLTVCRVATPEPRLLVLATSFVPFALLGYLLAASLLGLLRRRATAEARRWTTAAQVVAVVGAVVHAGLLAPSYVGAHPAGPPDLTVLTAILRLGQADAGEVATAARGAGADVVVLEEVTAAEAQALVDAGLRRDLPYVVGAVGVIAEGTVIASRFPITDVRRLPVSNGAWRMRVQAPRPFTLVAVHASQPLRAIERWRADHAVLRDTVRHIEGPLVVAGDFNATLDHEPMRRLLGTGLRDAARQANSGWQPTWPGDPDAYHGLPLGIGLLTLDHVLLSSELGAVSTDTAAIAGTDHRALVARIAWR
jgi:endonuclease/exonuclease/phosphatase (EEP) superfamily protein YafD